MSPSNPNRGRQISHFHNWKMIRGVTAFRIKIARVEGKWKMGQNRPAHLRQRALNELRARAGDNEQAVARLMEATIRTEETA